jgi:hypothetical protein
VEVKDGGADANGKGLFASSGVGKGDIVLEFTRMMHELGTGVEYDEYCKHYTDRCFYQPAILVGSTKWIKLGTEQMATSRTSECSSIPRGFEPIDFFYANHANSSSDVNVTVVGNIELGTNIRKFVVRATKDIRHGDEILWSYAPNITF